MFVRKNREKLSYVIIFACFSLLHDQLKLNPSMPKKTIHPFKI